MKTVYKKLQVIKDAPQVAEFILSIDHVEKTLLPLMAVPDKGEFGIPKLVIE